MPSLTTLGRRWQQLLDDLIRGLDIPGAAVGVSHNGERLILTAGTENMRSGHPVIPQTAFQLGSISKIYTTTVLAALTGLSDGLLQTPVRELVPEAAWMTPEISFWHLLTHSSGLGGDYFADTGRGDDYLARYVRQMESLPNDFPGSPGLRCSYCNTGFAVLGRLIEVLTGTTFDVALKQQLLHPLGLKATAVLPEETLLGPSAMGHNRAGAMPLQPDQAWRFPRNRDPIGGVCAPADDVLTFAELHLAGGLARDGRRVIPEHAAIAMRSRQLEHHQFTRPIAHGLGWGIFDGEAGEVVGHNGSTIGQVAMLRLVPQHQLALTVLTNGAPDGGLLTQAVEKEVLGEWGFAPKPIPVLRPDNFDPVPYLGVYRNSEGRAEVTATTDGLQVRTVQEAEGLFGREQITSLVPVDETAFTDADDPDPISAVIFDDPDPQRGGRRQSYSNGRLFWRVQ